MTTARLVYGSSESEGPGGFTPDGCPVELYRRAVRDNLPGPVRALIRQHSSLLDLCSGPGGATLPLYGEGMDVEWVDWSAAMLTGLPAGRTHPADATTVRLPRSFDVVLLASGLVNTRSDTLRMQFLRTCVAHVGAAGTILVERWPPAWFADPQSFTADVGNLRMAADVLGVTSYADVRFTYRIGADRWTQRVHIRDWSDAQVDADCARLGLRWAYAGGDAAWLALTPVA